MKKMTDVDIKKAFECCEANEGCSPKCEECPCFLLKEHSDRCYIEVRKQVLDLINRKNSRIAELTEENNRQKAEIELLKERIIEVQRGDKELIETLHKVHEEKIETAKVEAIKEFEERLHEYVSQIDTSKSYDDKDDIVERIIFKIDNLVKERVGEKR